MLLLKRLLVAGRTGFLRLGRQRVLLFESCGKVLHDDRGNIGCRDRTAEQEALDEIAFESAEEIDLFLGLDALGSDRQAKRAAKRNDRLKHAAGARIGDDSAHKSLIDLYLGEREDKPAIEVRRGPPGVEPSNTARPSGRPR